MSYDTPLTPQGQQLATLPMREQLRRGFKDMGSRSFSSAKNFGMIGAMFAGTECVIEGVIIHLSFPQLGCKSSEGTFMANHRCMTTSF